jgi:hypothetical protein
VNEEGEAPEGAGEIKKEELKIRIRLRQGYGEGRRKIDRATILNRLAAVCQQLGMGIRRGRPLGRVVNSKKYVRPDFFVSVLSKRFLKAASKELIRACDFFCSIAAPLSRRGDPFSHPSGSSAALKVLLRPISNTRDPENVQCRAAFIQLQRSCGFAPALKAQERPTRF